MERQIAEKLEKKRGEIAADEACRAKQLLATELDHKAKAVAELEDISVISSLRKRKTPGRNFCAGSVPIHADLVRRRRRRRTRRAGAQLAM